MPFAQQPLAKKLQRRHSPVRGHQPGLGYGILYTPRPSLPLPDSCREGGHRLGKGHLSSGICMHGALFPGGGGERWAGAMLLCERAPSHTLECPVASTRVCIASETLCPSPPSHSCSPWVAARRDCREEGGSSGRMRWAVRLLCITLAPFAASFEGAILGASAPSASDVPSSFHALFVYCGTAVARGIPG